MLMTRGLIESVLPDNLKQLIDDGKIENLKTVVENLQSSLVQVKDDIKSLTRTNYKKLKPEIEKTENLIKQINTLHSKINLIKNDLKENENLLKNVSEIEEYKNLIDRIELINKIIVVIEFLRKYDQNLEEFKSSIDEKDYLKCNHLLSKLTDITKNYELPFKNAESSSTTSDMSLIGLNNEIKELEDILVFKELKEDFIVHRERLWFELDQEWDKILKIDASNDNDNDQQQTKAACLQISTNISQDYLDKITIFSKFKSNSVITGTFSTFSFVFMSKMKQFAKKFLEYCQTYITTTSNRTNDLEIVIDSTNSLKRLIFKKTSSTAKSLEESSSSDLLKLKLNQIETILTFLNENLFKYKVFIYKNESEHRLTLMSIFSDLILNDFVKLIYEQLIISIIPLKNFDFGLETKICEQVAKFEEKLKSIEFLATDKSLCSTSIFGTFVNNVEELYVRKKCKYIIETARELMKQNELLFDKVKVNERSDNLELVRNLIRNSEKNSSKSSSGVNYLLNELLKREEKISNDISSSSPLDEMNLLQMYECSISKIAKQLVDMIYDTLNEALKMIENTQSVKNVSMLCLVGKNLFDLYSNVIPTYYRNKLNEIPLLSALCYNDFNYLAFNCLTITHQYKKLFLNLRSNRRETSKESKHLNLNYTDIEQIIEHFSCLDLIPKLCSTGSQILNKQLERQQLLLLQFLYEDSPGIKDLSESNNYEMFKKALQKCILQINNLSSVWINLLSTRVYFRVFGQFYNSICNDLLKSCLKLEDISSDDASYLYDAFSLIKQSVYNTFSRAQSNDLLKENLNDDNNNNDDDDDESNESKNAESNDDDLVKLSVNNNLAEVTATKYIQSWQRFKYLLIILKVSLQEIVDLWSDRQGPLGLYFDSEEVRHLIKALFMITDKRSAALAKIK